MSTPDRCPKCHCSEFTTTMDGGWRCNECKWDSYHQESEALMNLKVCPECSCDRLYTVKGLHVGLLGCCHCNWTTNKQKKVATSPVVEPKAYEVDMKEMLDALENMVGAFDTPLRRIKMPGEFQDEVCNLARGVLRKFGRR
jgi:hypothetical protein